MGRQARNLCRGAILLEVVLALGLFVGAAALLGGALSAALDGVERQRLDTHAANLAATALSEVQLGLRGIGSGSESSAVLEPPFQHWTVEVLATPMETELGETSGLTLVEVVVRHPDPPVTHRLAQVMKLSEIPRGETVLDLP